MFLEDTPTAIFGSHSATTHSDSAGMALVGRTGESAKSSTLEDGSHASSGDSAIYSLQLPYQQRALPTSPLAPIPGSPQGGLVSGRGRGSQVANSETGWAGRNRSRSTTPRSVSERCSKSGTSGQQGRSRRDDPARQSSPNNMTNDSETADQ